MLLHPRESLDGQPRSKSDPATASILNLSIVVLEAEILDMIQRHCALVRKRGGTAQNLGQLLAAPNYYPLGAPNPEREAWEQFGADFLEEIQQLLKEKPRPWTQHKLDLIAEYPDRFNPHRSGKKPRTLHGDEAREPAGLPQQVEAT